MMPPRVNITLESYDLANMGGDIIALGAHFVFWLLFLIIMEIGCCCCCMNASKSSREQSQAGEGEAPMIEVTDLQKIYSS